MIVLVTLCGGSVTCSVTILYGEKEVITKYQNEMGRLIIVVVCYGELTFQPNY